MDIKNINDFVSGGYIYDQLDRFAQKLVMEKSDSKYNFTYWAFIKYPKQLCQPDYYIGFNWCKKINKRIYIAKVYAKDRNGVKVAWAIFCFVGTSKNYCELKKSENYCKYCGAEFPPSKERIK